MPDKREPLTPRQARAMLPPRVRHIHTFLGQGPIMVGADWSRRDVLILIRRGDCEKAGPIATGGGHGLAVREGPRLWFIETRPEPTS